MTEYFELLQFFGGYLNEDWPDEYADEWAALDNYLHDSPGVAPEFCKEIQALLDDHPSEDEVSKVLSYDLACAYAAENLGWKYRDWLKALSDYATKAIGHPQAS